MMPTGMPITQAKTIEKMAICAVMGPRRKNVSLIGVSTQKE
jgi:hypothetical protein